MANGDRLEGNWLNGKQHGLGVNFKENGVRREGEWRTGKRVKWIS